MMGRLFRQSIWFMLLLLLAACNLGNPPQAPTARPTLPPAATFTPLPSLTPLPSFNNVAPPTAVSFPTAISFPTVAPVVQQPVSLTRLLTNGTGLSTGRTINTGEIEVEGYCSVLNPSYGVEEDGRDWYCTFNGQRAMTLREQHFSDICRRTYNNLNAFAVFHNDVQPPAFGWRCYEYTITPTPTIVKTPVLLTNGIGLSTGNRVTDGNFEVEAYCTVINPAYGVDEDGRYWYCTHNGQNVLTLGQAEFDDICFRTYGIAGAFAVQQSNPVPAYGWRCYAYLD